MDLHKTIIGEKEYVIHKIAPFAANTMILKIQKLVLPVIGSMAGGQNIMDMDMKEVFSLVSEKLDEKVMVDIVMPLFKLSQVSSATDNVKIDSEVNFNKVFTTDNLADFYELLFEVLKFNFGNFFAGLASRFGNSGGVGAVSQASKESAP